MRRSGCITMVPTPLGIGLMAVNINDIGGYAGASAGGGGGLSGSVGVSAGVFESLESARGPYLEVGGSGGEGLGFGVDVASDIKAQNTIGGNLTVSAGVGTPAEGHIRAGVSGFVSFTGK